MEVLKIKEEGCIGNGELISAEDTVITFRNDCFEVKYDFTMFEDDDKLGIPKEIRYSANMFYWKDRIDGVECYYESEKDRYCVIIATGVQAYRQYFKENSDAIVLYEKLLNWLQNV